MVLLDPKVLAEATSAFLAQAQKQADHNPGAISRLEQEAKALREAVTALQGRLDQQEGSAAAVRHEKDLEGLRERVAALEDQASQNVEAAWELHERVSSLETAREGARACLFLGFVDRLSICGQRLLNTDTRCCPQGGPPPELTVQGVRGLLPRCKEEVPRSEAQRPPGLHLVLHRRDQRQGVGSVHPGIPGKGAAWQGLAEQVPEKRPCRCLRHRAEVGGGQGGHVTHADPFFLGVGR